MLNIWTRIRTNLNPSKRIRTRIRSENIRTEYVLHHQRYNNIQQQLNLRYQQRHRSMYYIQSPSAMAVIVCPRGEQKLFSQEMSSSSSAELQWCGTGQDFCSDYDLFWSAVLCSTVSLASCRSECHSCYQ